VSDDAASVIRQDLPRYPPRRSSDALKALMPPAAALARSL
jgi:hypothetical protein